MIQFEDFPELITSNNFEENQELNILEKSLEFTENFNKIFPVNKNKEIILDNESESEYIIKDKENPINFINESKEITLDKSKQKINIKDNINEFSSIVNSINLPFCNKNNFNYSIYFLTENNDNNKNIPQIENIKPKKEINNKFLCKKKKIFYVNYRENFEIFNSGIYNKSSKKIINETLEELYKNKSNTMNSGIMGEFKTQKNNKKKKIKNIFKRKENSDNIRKKIKSRFLKDLKNTINKKLKIAGSNKFFKLLPQKFITNITKEKNKPILNLTFKELFSKNFCENGKECGPDFKNYHHNLTVLNYLEKNKNIGESSNYSSFKNMTFNQIYNEYLKSKEFEIEIASLKQEKENDKYIKEYIIKASNLINFFSN